MAYAIHYNGNAKILFYIGGKKVKRKRHKRYLLMPFFISKLILQNLCVFHFFISKRKRYDFTHFFYIMKG